MFLCVALKSPQEYYEGCKALLERLEFRAGKVKEKAATTALTPTVFYFILENREDLTKSKITQAILSMKALNISFLPLTDGDLVEEAARLAEEKETDFDDAVNALIMKRSKIKEIYALDMHYDRFEWIKRVVP
ncbi:MAG: PIN domain-containing protein [Euryarchaeota archaeon]|nr:PIN domain-containing protein [Euryarchaeota archaeon]